MRPTDSDPTRRRSSHELLSRERMVGLYRYLSRRTGDDRELAVDATQACLRVPPHWRQRTPRDPDAWLRTTALRVLAHHYRRRAPEPLLVEAGEIAPSLEERLGR